MDETDQIATQLRMAQLQNKKAGDKPAKKPAKPAASALTFQQKISEHQKILIAAGFFDLIAMIPLVSIATNPMFGVILFLYFKPKSKGGSELLKIGLPTGVSTILDTLSSLVPILDLLPFNVGTALLRIALS